MIFQTVYPHRLRARALALLAFASLASPLGARAEMLAAEAESAGYSDSLSALDSLLGGESGEGMGPSQCADLKARRLERKRLWENQGMALEPSATHRAFRERVVEVARAGAKDLLEKRARDLSLIWDEFRQAAKAPEFSWNRRSAAAALVAHMTQVARRVTQPPKLYTTWNGIDLNPANYRFAHWLDYMVLDRARALVGRVSATPGTLKDAEALRALAITDYAPDYDEDKQLITPYEARGLLFYALPLEARQRVIDQLQIRFDIRDVVAPATFAALNKLCGASAYDCSLLSDGYLYGVTFPGSERLMGATPSDDRFSKGTGIDCSTWVQWAFLQAGIGAEAFPFRITTGAMIAEPKLTYNSELKSTCVDCHPAFRTDPIRSEWELVPGDAIVYVGHTQIFLGYDDRGNFLVSEAVGGRRRTIVESALDVYTDGKCAKPFTAGKPHYRMYPAP